MPLPAPRVVLDGLVFPEGARWHQGKVWFADMHGFKVMTLDEQGKAEVICHVPNKPSGIGFLPDGRMIVVSMMDKRLLRLERDGRLTTLADVSAFCGGEANDMIVDKSGHAYIGNLGYATGQPFKKTRIVLVTPDGAIRPVGEELELPNGCAVTADGKTLIAAESRGHRLTAFDIAADGGLVNRRLFADLGDLMPDGICLDAEGAVWVGAVTNSQFVRVLPGGRITDRIEAPGKYAVACVLGGRDRQTLFLCTAKTNRDDLAKGKSIGWIEIVRVPVPGAGVP
jgi:sugar lactone lactonase YvrE